MISEKIYETVDVTHWWSQGRVVALKRVLERMVPQGGPALDVGAGGGLWASNLKAFDPVWVVEPEMNRYRVKLEAAGLRSRAVAAALPGPLPFSDRSFRLLSCLDVVEHLEDDFSSIAELARLVGPGGHLLVTVPAHLELWSSLDETVGHQRRYSRAAFSTLLRSTGFEVRMISPLNVWLYPAVALMRRIDRPDDVQPGPFLNRTLAWIFGSEGWLAGRWPKGFKGLSWVGLARRPAPLD